MKKIFLKYSLITLILFSMIGNVNAKTNKSQENKNVELSLNNNLINILELKSVTERIDITPGAASTNDKNSQIKTISCGNVKNIPASVPRITRSIYNVVKIFIPIIIIFLGFFDLFKAVTANDEGNMRSSASKLVKRIIAGLAVFFVFAAVQMMFGMVEKSGASNSNDISSCISCFISTKQSCGETSTLNFD